LIFRVLDYLGRHHEIYTIKDVTVEKRGIIATGYKVPISTGSMERIIKVLEDAEPKR
jgi:hypothetical protein